MKKKNENLTDDQKLILFEEGTEPPGSSGLNSEKREGSYHCVNCGIKLFESDSIFDSGSAPFGRLARHFAFRRPN